MRDSLIEMVWVLLGLAGVGIIYLVIGLVKRRKTKIKITRIWDRQSGPALIIWDDIQGTPPTPEETQKMREWFETSPFNYKVGGEQDKDSGDNR